VNHLNLHHGICALLAVGVMSCGGGDPVRPMLPKRASAPPQVDALLQPLTMPAVTPLEERITTARAALAPTATGSRWLPTQWSTPRFVWFGGLAKNLEPVRGLCATIVDEALPADTKVPCDALQAAIARAETEGAALARLPQPLDEAAHAQLKSKVLELGPTQAVKPKTKTLDPAVVDRLLGGGHGRARTPKDVTTWSKQLDVRDAALAEVELAAWRVLMHYGWAVHGRHAPAHHTRITEQHQWVDAIRRRRAKRKDLPWTERAYPADWPDKAEDATDAAMQRVARQIGSTPADLVLAELRPKGGQYTRLVAARARYRQIVEAGGFVEVPRMERARRKKKHKHVPKLRARLAQEGFATEPENPEEPDRFDNTLAQALLDYQSAHLLRPRAKVGPKTRKTFAISASEKLARIDAALEAWRRVLPRPDYFVQVNIPDFHVEVWKKTKRLDRIRVVVGNAKRERKKGKLIRPNATPVMHAEIEHVVYNPYWNIPQRILEEEVIGEEVREEDNEVQVAWLEEKGYEVLRPGTKWQRVRQLPGRRNPLGRVKILFPNPHEVYLHDTPARSLFRRPVRAYSHGCMRVHKPLRLAQVLLEQDGQFDAQRVRHWLRQDEPETVTLKQSVPIFVEYIPVRVDDSNRTWFMRDVYKQFDVAGLTAR
jgi:murein L,D-transpeptidase YcbB/YkuD